MITIPDNVWAFIARAADDAGRIEAERFRQEMHSQIVDGGFCPIESPIEQLFFVAVNTMVLANGANMNPEPVERDGVMCAVCGIYLTPQFRVDQYRVDFRVMRRGYGHNAVDNVVLVELDGHAFHDRDARQRSYEKARARHFARRGFKVLHYTGSDVVADPYRVAYEVLDTIEAFAPMGYQPYDPANPLGID